LAYYHHSRGGVISGRAARWLGRSQKDGLPSCREGGALKRFKAINSR